MPTNEVVHMVQSEMALRKDPNSTKADKIASYARTVAVYDECALSAGYVGHTRVVDALLPHLPHGDLRVLDVGCGTGLCGDHLRRVLADRPGKLALVGIDYSPEMLEKAANKGTFDNLLEVDIEAAFELPGAPYDVMIASGVFLDHCVDPPALINIAEHMREGSISCISVRKATFDGKRDEYDRVIAKAGFVIVKADEDNYAGDGSRAVYLVLKKVAK